MSLPAPEVLLSVTMLRPEEKLLLRALRAEGLTVLPALREDLAPVLSGDAQPPLVALMRNLSHSDTAGLARRLEVVGIRTINSPTAIETCNDKGIQALLFARNGVPHPASRHAFGFGQVREAVAAVGWPAVVKPVSGSWGLGVTRLVDAACLDAWIGGRESADASGKLFPVLVQEHVDKPGHDLRVVVVGRTPIVVIRRISEGWRTNTHLGAQAQSVEVTPEIAKRCNQVVDVLGDGFYGIDLVEDTSTGVLKVLEVNANPDFARSSAIHGVDVAAHVASHVAARVRDAGAPTAM